jgi:hypothetical protein
VAHTAEDLSRRSSSLRQSVEHFLAEVRAA